MSVAKLHVLVSVWIHSSMLSNKIPTVYRYQGQRQRATPLTTNERARSSSNSILTLACQATHSSNAIRNNQPVSLHMQPANLRP